MLLWNDITTYSKGDTVRQPTSFECRLTQRINMKVHRHIHYGDQWLLTSEYVGLDKRELDTSNLDDAKEKAVAVVLAKLDEMGAEIRTAMAVLK